MVLSSILSDLNQDYFRLASNLQMLEIIRNKISVRGFKDFDKEDIMGEIGIIQARLSEMDSKLNAIANALK